MRRVHNDDDAVEDVGLDGNGQKPRLNNLDCETARPAHEVRVGIPPSSKPKLTRALPLLRVRRANSVIRVRGEHLRHWRSCLLDPNDVDVELVELQM